MMSPVCFVNPVADIAADIQPVVVPDAQVAVPDLRPVRQTDRKIIRRDPLLFGPRFAGLLKAQKNLFSAQFFNRQEFHTVLLEDIHEKWIAVSVMPRYSCAGRITSE